MIGAIGVLLAGFSSGLGALTRWLLGFSVSRFVNWVTKHESAETRRAWHRFLSPPVFFGLPIPWHTLIINLLGSFAAGFCAALLPVDHVVSDPRFELLYAMASVGFLGGFTIYGTFTVEIGTFLSERRYRLALSYVLVSVLVGLCLGMAGYYFGEWVEGWLLAR